jgi:hypothetical protein
MNELAKTVIEDGQELRPFHNYLSETFDGIKNKKLNFEGTEFKDRIEFYKFLRDSVLFVLINSAEQWKLDEPEEYELGNK